MTNETDPDCPFCGIVAGAIPAEEIHRDERTVAFRDINPAAPVHALVIPIQHYPTMAALVAADPPLAAEVVSVATQIATSEGLDEGGYRLVTNTGTGAGQSVFHVHLHVLGGRPMTWPPG